jgi:hypothetical protein
MAEEETRPEDEIEQLRKHKERIELKAQIDSLTAPWWRRAGLIATLATIAAAVWPVTTAIQEHYRGDRELELQQSEQRNALSLQQAKQEHEIRMAYLDRFAVPGHRLQTLRFLLATSTDAQLLAWAREEKAIVEAQLEDIEAELEDVRKKLEDAPPGPARDQLKEKEEALEESAARTIRKRVEPPQSPVSR